MERFSICMDGKLKKKSAAIAKKNKRSLSGQISIAMEEQISRQLTTEQQRNQIIENSPHEHT